MLDQRREMIVAYNRARAQRSGVATVGIFHRRRSRFARPGDRIYEIDALSIWTRSMELFSALSRWIAIDENVARAVTEPLRQRLLSVSTGMLRQTLSRSCSATYCPCDELLR